jgi:hypothetical protein
MVRKRGVKGKPRDKKRFIVRLMNDSQYYVSMDTARELNRLDNRLVRILKEDRPNEDEVRDIIAGMRILVKSNGKRMRDDKIVPSDVIIPVSDISIDEAKGIFKGEGIIPDIL